MKFIGLIYIAAALFLTVSLAGYSAADPPEFFGYTQNNAVQNYCGLPGALVSAVLLNAFGYAAYLLAAFFAAIGIQILRQPTENLLNAEPVLKTAGLLFVAFGAASLVSLLPPQTALLPCPVIGAGGYSGVILTALLVPCVQIAGTVIFSASLILTGAVLYGGDTLFDSLTFQTVKADKRELLQSPIQQAVAAKVPDWNVDEIAPPEKQRTTKLFSFAAKTETKAAANSESNGGESNDGGVPMYQLPKRDLLTVSEPPEEDSQMDKVHEHAVQLKKKLAEFKINAEVVDVQTGPVISQFEVKLAPGTRVRKIQQLEDDLAVAFRAENVRIVAPIPGKNTVGVELPNEHRQTVRLRDVVELCPEAAEKYALPIYLGKDVSGQPLTADLAKMPHLLIAGRTGTGKSVCLNSIIVSLLMTRSPDQVRLLMIDPKMVEMSAYKKIPHLMHPVITDMKKAESLLAWTVMQMEERYQLLASAGVKHLSEYNQLPEDELRRRMEMIDLPDEQWDDVPKKMPYIVVIADEMADLMMTAAKEVESHIIRLAQKSRAVGIHLVLATQKPTVDVLTGLIKSNLPARLAFGVASGMDSKVVLDRTGAERLLGNGDMLFLQPGTSSLIRGQGTFVSDTEIDAVNAAIAVDEPDFIEELLEPDKEQAAAGGESFDDDGEKVLRDDLYYEAVEFVIQQGRGSVSLLQRRFSIGYGRASRMIDYMAEDGVVGEYRGSKPREVRISLTEWRRKRGTRTVTSAAAGAAHPAVRTPAPHTPPYAVSSNYIEEDEFVAT
ncbi:MAG: DNA translocase FtsK 4TM domain-containing protein [Planctomycetaceae bacterium]|jgi:S-DNA-T family DNA segregation ATPase FtsK/SpoIIIE|nr:DNA translocase FtsK 4TM domain-containing protein [Planctomycetaceae bacterium]